MLRWVEFTSWIFMMMLHWILQRCWHRGLSNSQAEVQRNCTFKWATSYLIFFPISNYHAKYFISNIPIFFFFKFTYLGVVMTKNIPISFQILISKKYISKDTFFVKIVNCTAKVHSFINTQNKIKKDISDVHANLSSTPVLQQYSPQHTALWQCSHCSAIPSS